MLSALFRFVLRDISSHPVLHDLLHSFRIERPLPSSRVPPWDLLLVLTLLRGSPFEPLSSCSLQDLSRKVLFFVSLATARHVGELHAVSSCLFRVAISSSHIFQNSGPSPNPLPTLFRGIFVSARLVILWATCRMSCYFVLCGLKSLLRSYFFSFSSSVFSLFPHALLLVLCLRTP